MHAQASTTRAFSLVELVLVVVIMGLIGAIAIPRISRAGIGSREAALIQNLSIMNRAVQRFRAEHMGLIPSNAQQLLMFSDEAGNTSTTRAHPHIFGPYLNKLPVLPLGSNRGESRIVFGGQPGEVSGAGWWIDPVTGEVRANLPDDETNDDGKPFNKLGGSDSIN